MKNVLTSFAVTGLLASALFVLPNAHAQQAPPAEIANRTVAITRGQIVPRIEPMDHGVRIIIDTYEITPGADPIDLTLQALIDPDPANTARRPEIEARNAAKLSAHQFAINQATRVAQPNPPTPVLEPDPLYRNIEFLMKLENPVHTESFQNGSRYTFEIPNTQLNAVFQMRFPNAPQLRPTPGTPLFVHGRWTIAGHNWGSVDRGGLIFIPQAPGQPTVESGGYLITRPQGLDVAIEIDDSLKSVFQDPAITDGLKSGGQIRSRIEGEGKYQIESHDLAQIKRALFDLANDPQKAEALFGQGWTFRIEDRYMLRDESGVLKLGPDGFPIPDPMVDTYFDNLNHDGAKNDVALRYRWTAGNQTGAWNFKPGYARLTGDGIMYRIEYGVDTDSDQPVAIARFADSFDSRNPFQEIRRLTGKTPSEFFNPSVKIIDHRYKFKLEHETKLAIELSLDEVLAENLREGHARTANFTQLELDIDHLATASKSSIQPGTANAYYVDGSALGEASATAGPASQFIGGISLHTEADLARTSPIITQHQTDFDLSKEVIVKLRKAVLGPLWKPAPQKYALAARELGIVQGNEISPSTRRLERRERVIERFNARQNAAAITEGSAAVCRTLFQSP